jgi:two-component system, chemotaxis family, chemotaxis protein CheY
MRKYLIVEDDKVMHIIYARKFGTDKELKEFSGHSCYGFKEAIDYVNSLSTNEMPEFILLDINLESGFTGWDFLKSEAFARLPETVKVFVCTSSVSNSDMVFSMQFPSVKGYFIKPFNVNNLKTITALVNKAE